MTDCRVMKACTAIKIAKLICSAFFRTTLIDITVKIFDLFYIISYFFEFCESSGVILL